MSENKFKKGDVVRLKGGDLQMTVFEEDAGFGVGCVWHNLKTGEEEKSDYPPETLKKCDSE